MQLKDLLPFNLPRVRSGNWRFVRDVVNSELPRDFGSDVKGLLLLLLLDPNQRLFGLDREWQDLLNLILQNI